jgi:hypothetical protein
LVFDVSLADFQNEALRRTVEAVMQQRIAVFNCLRRELVWLGLPRTLKSESTYIGYVALARTFLKGKAFTNDHSVGKAD